MSDYISKQAAVDALAKTMPTPATPDGAGEFDHEIHIADEAFADAIRIIESIEPADVVQVVRCKDCENWQTDWNPSIPDRHYCAVMDSMMKANDFCSYGEMREDTSNG